MTLLKSFAQVDEYGRIGLGRNFMIQMGLNTNSLVFLKVFRITGSRREPYLILHGPGKEPRSTALETVMFESSCRIDEDCNILLDNEVMAEAEFEPGLCVEFKLTGPTNAPWLTIRNKGSKRLTTLQKKMGLNQKKRWRSMTMEY